MVSREQLEALAASVPVAAVPVDGFATDIFSVQLILAACAKAGLYDPATARPPREGKYFLTRCFNATEHSDTKAARTTTALLAPHPPLRQFWGYVCKRDHCAALGFSDLLRYLRLSPRVPPDVPPPRRDTAEVAHDLAGGGGLAPGAHPATAKGQEPASDHATSPPFSLVTPDTHFITKYVGYAAECTDAPLAAHELMSIGLLSSVAGPRVRFPVNWRPRGLPLTVWIHYVVDSAMGRKSTVQDVGVDLAREVLPATSFFEWEGSQQGLIQRLADIDGTPLLFPRDELSGLMAQVKQGGHLAGLPQTLIRAYDVRPLENVRTRKRKDAGGKAEPDTDRAVEPYLVLLAASTRDSLLEYVGTPDYLSGFMPRFLVYSGSADPKPSRRPSEAILTARRELVSHLRRIRERAAAIPGPLGVDDAVYEAAWGLEQQWTHTVKNTVVRSSVAGAIVKRLLESLYKVAALLALDRAKAYVTAEDYQQATAMGQRWLASALELAQAAAASRFEKQCALVLEVIGDDWTTMRTILRRHRWLRIKHLEDILAALEEQAEIDVEYPKSEKGLKPRKVRRRS